MRLTSITLLLPTLALAADQVPLADKVKGWFKQAQSYIPSSPPSVPNPVSYGTQKIANALVSNLTLENWRATVESAPAPKSGASKDWFIYVTGGNKTCFGLCGKADAAWKEAAPILKLKSNGPRLAQVDCERDELLCKTWHVLPPYLYIFEIPNTLPGQSRPDTPVYGLPLNRSGTTARDFDKFATQKSYREAGAYTGFFHPFDGIVTKAGLDVPIGYVVYYFSKLPSWAPMVVVSLITRTFMSRKVNAAQARRDASQAAGAGAPAQGARR